MTPTYLVVSRDTVWTLEPNGLPIDTQLEPSAYLKRRLPKFLALAGHAVNAELLVALVNKRSRGLISSLCIGTPYPAPNYRFLTDPTCHLMELAGLNYASSLGGWHQAGDVDYYTYMLAQPGRHNDRSLLHRHPLYEHARFLTGLDEGALAVVITEILDPRWWVRLNNPNSDLPLLKHFGLTAAGMPADPAVLYRQSALEQLWCRPVENLQSPGAFAHRYLAEQTRSYEAALRATNVMVLRYLLAGWRACTALTHASRLFVPEDFFDKQALAAYRQRV